MTKISKIFVKENTYNGKTSKSYTVSLNNGITGFINSKGADAFREGDEVGYVVEVKKSSQGKEYNQLTLTKSVSATPPPPPAPNIQAPPTPDPRATKSSSTLKEQSLAKVPFTAIEKVVDLVIGGKVPWEKVKEYHKELCQILYDEINSASGE